MLERAAIIGVEHVALGRTACQDRGCGIPRAIAILVCVHDDLHILVDKLVAVVVGAVAHLVGSRIRDRIGIIAVEIVLRISVWCRRGADQPGGCASIAVTVAVDLVLDRLEEFRIERAPVILVEGAVRVRVTPDPERQSPRLERKRVTRVQVAADRELHHLSGGQLEIHG